MKIIFSKKYLVFIKAPQPKKMNRIFIRLISNLNAHFNRIYDPNPRTEIEQYY